MFFLYDQNNSGGSFDIDDEKGIGPSVWIEANDKRQANARATEELGIYFCGVEAGIDCECCGDRWSSPWSEDGETEVEISKYDFYWHDTVYVHRLDGTIERIKKEEPAQ